MQNNWQIIIHYFAILIMFMVFLMQLSTSCRFLLSFFFSFFSKKDTSKLFCCTCTLSATWVFVKYLHKNILYIIYSTYQTRNFQNPKDRAGLQWAFCRVELPYGHLYSICALGIQSFLWMFGVGRVLSENVRLATCHHLQPTTILGFRAATISWLSIHCQLLN